MIERNNRKMIVAIYVGDFLVCHDHPQDLEWFMKNLSKEYKFRNLGKVQTCLGLQIERDVAGNYSIHQKDYIKRMGEKFNILHDKRAKTPLDTNKFKEDDEKVN